MSRELLLEIGTEEIPAGIINDALSSLREMAISEFEALRIKHGSIHCWATPRRLVLYVEGVEEKQQDMDLEVIGPPKSVAYDSNGEPTKAAIGFAKGQGVRVEELSILHTEKGEYLCAKKRIAGESTSKLLPSIFLKLISQLNFPKSMRWMDLDLRFVRPIHWILSLYGNELIPFRYGNIQSNCFTYGHRFMHKGPIKIEEPSKYLNACEKAFVIVDQLKRKEEILKQIDRAASSVGGRVIFDEELLEEVTNLVEYPLAICGGFDRVFLELPRDVLITAMREHQRYFTIVNENGDILPYFVCVANTMVRDPDRVRKGNERVLRARLQDARYFFKEDIKRPLLDRVDDLKGIVFHSKLGTSYEKVMRFQRLAIFLADLLEPSVKDIVKRASLLCKADLTTEMVGEFPTLQGKMGYYYASISGEPEDVCLAIYEHYLPNFSGDRLPETPAGSILSMADKMDTIVGYFGVGIIPTGAGDPFGLRRAALGIIQIILARNYRISLRCFIDEAISGLSGLIERGRSEVIEDVLNFFKARIQNLWREEGHNLETIEAVLSQSFDDIIDARARLESLSLFMKEEEFGDLAIAFKRIINIVGNFSEEEVDPLIFESPYEWELYRSFMRLREELIQIFKEGRYLEALRSIAGIKREIHQFFNNVMVNVEDPTVRKNRLSLLKGIARLFIRIADFSKISTR